MTIPSPPRPPVPPAPLYEPPPPAPPEPYPPLPPSPPVNVPEALFVAPPPPAPPVVKNGVLEVVKDEGFKLIKPELPTPALAAKPNVPPLSWGINPEVVIEPPENDDHELVAPPPPAPPEVIVLIVILSPNVIFRPNAPFCPAIAFTIPKLERIPFV